MGQTIIRRRKRQININKVMPCYRDRFKNVRLLGFDSYKQYLKSDLWEAVRKLKLESEPFCQKCRKPATQVHHLSYALEVLVGSVLSGLFSCCRACHEAAEIQNGEKATLGQANDSLGCDRSTLGRIAKRDRFNQFQFINERRVRLKHQRRGQRPRVKQRPMQCRPTAKLVSPLDGVTNEANPRAELERHHLAACKMPVSRRVDAISGDSLATLASSTAR